MRDWVRSTQGAPWGTGYSSGYGRWFERAASATGDAASVVANNRSGRAFQQLVSDALEVPENFALMEGAPINIETRPDLLVDVALGEVKNYERSVLSYSSQIEAQMNAAISSGKTYVLITSPFTEATQQLIEAVRSINGIMVTFDPVTGAFTPWW